MTSSRSFAHTTPAPGAPEAAPAAKLVEDHRDVLDGFARAARLAGESGETKLLVLIELESSWRPLAAALMPGANLEPLRTQAAQRGDRVMVSSIHPRGRVVALLAGCGINIGPTLEDPPPALGGSLTPGAFWVVVCFGKQIGLARLPAPALDPPVRTRRGSIAESVGTEALRARRRRARRAN
jgi:hypothetical protein